MSLPLNVIEQLARKLRNRETTIALQALNAYTRVARRALLQTGAGCSEIDLMEIRTSQIERVLPLPFAEHAFADDSSYVEFDEHRVVPDAINATPHGLEWVIVARGDEGKDYIVAAQDPHVFGLGEVVTATSIKHYEDSCPVKYNNLILASNVGIYVIESWPDAALVLRGLFSPVENEEFTIDVNVTLSADTASQVDDLSLSKEQMVRAGGAVILGAGPLKTSRRAIEIPQDASDEQVSRIVAFIDTVFATPMPEAEVEAERDALVDRLFSLYEADIRRAVGTVEGSVSDIKLRKAFKDHFIKKWKLN
ncbi:hypothetical protein pEaSNUABM11_00229 [Erwinia phage pEa_SNUABM_11]|nr:hypothetical protein pEaSNUABM11_00229 [Erwinia phage pEa_SNUABM_11]